MSGAQGSALIGSTAPSSAEPYTSSHALCPPTENPALRSALHTFDSEMVCVPYPYAASALDTSTVPLRTGYFCTANVKATCTHVPAAACAASDVP
eukprot:1525074-Rhodomonas_salina.1